MNENISTLLSNIIDGNHAAAKDIFNDIVHEKVLNRIDDIKNDIGNLIFNKDEIVSENFYMDDYKLALGNLLKVINDVKIINEEWDEMPEEEKEEFDGDEWDWEPEEDEDLQEAVNKRYLNRYHDSYAALMEDFDTKLTNNLSSFTFNFNELKEEVQPIAEKIIMPAAEKVYDTLANLNEEDANNASRTLHEIISSMNNQIYKG